MCFAFRLYVLQLLCTVLPIADSEPLRHVPYSISRLFNSHIHICHDFILNHKPDVLKLIMEGEAIQPKTGAFLVKIFQDDK
jgi:hypothetical protein